jgi:Glucoamylase and related glycosyl hydrolases
MGQGTAIYSIGNGRILAYGRQADILQLSGPPYSSPSVWSMTLEPGLDVTSVREKGTAVWHHQIMRNGKPVAEITDFMPMDQPCFVRKIKAASSFYFNTGQLKEGVVLENLAAFTLNQPVTSAFLLKTPAGTFFYNDYPVLEEACHQFITLGNATLTPGKLQIEKGESVFLVAGGPSYPECTAAAHLALSTGIDRQLGQSRTWWAGFTAQRKDFDNLLPASLPLRDKLLQTIDDVSVMIKCQQATEGAVIAGYNYHLGYVRDQYGVSRGLLKLGYTNEARQILRFYYDIWKREGRIQNAQGVGNKAFHVHENDHVEITGYLIIQAFDYLKSTGDEAFIREIFPMLNWAWQVQTGELIKGMLPFNGDETFVAGGILPRTALCDGSAEATLLFINAGEALVTWSKKNRMWSSREITRAEQILAETKALYPGNFISGGKLQTNNPGRMEGQEYPPFRHGVCEQMGHVEGCQFFGWTQKTSTNRYLCTNCYVKSSLPAVRSETYFLPSVTMMPCYIEDSFLDKQVQDRFINEMAVSWSETGRFSSRQEGTGEYKILGYDYGFFLYALVKTGNPLRYRIYEEMMHMLDETGAWVEYYTEGKPSGTFCRPWESAINLEAAILFAGYEKTINQNK